MIHELKCETRYFVRSARGLKPFEIRRNDRDFQVNDTIVMREWDCAGDFYTGREMEGLVKYVFHGGGQYGLSVDYVVMTMEWAEVKTEEPASLPVEGFAIAPQRERKADE